MEKNQSMNKSFHIANELNKLGNVLTLKVIDLLKEVDAYTYHYYDDEMFLPSHESMNEDNCGIVSRMIKKEETNRCS